MATKMLTTVSSVLTVILAVTSVLMHTGALHAVLTAPVVSQNYINLISSGCGYDERNQVMCTSELCIKKPFVIERGPPRQTILGSKTPSWIYIGHSVGLWAWKTNVLNITGVKNIHCLLEHLD